jgi:transposase-like protein
MAFLNPARSPRVMAERVERLRDIAIVHMIRRGYSLREIGQYLRISAGTVQRRYEKMTPAVRELYRDLPFLDL